MYKRATNILWWLTIASLYVLCFWVLFGNIDQDNKSLPPVEFPAYYLIEGNSIQPLSNPVYIKPQVLGMIIDDGLDYEQAKLLDKIEQCENPEGVRCNLECGCKCGMGPYQLIETTVKHCEKMLNKSIDPFIKKEAKECAIWLLENEGPHHWGYPPDDPRGYKNGIRWGTYDCWSQ